MRWLIGLMAVTCLAACDNSDSKNAAKPPQSQPAAASQAATPVTPPGYLPAAKSAGVGSVAESELAPIVLELPKALVVGTPKDAKGVNLDLKTLGKKRGPFIVPKGVELISSNKAVKLSDAEPAMGGGEMVTDGNKEGTDGSWVEMTFNPQWAQVDLGQSSELWAIVIWHFHLEPRVYRDVIVQISDDAEFKSGVTTLFNNDIDNTAGQGAGKDYEYFESNEGKLVDAKGTKARYVRCWSNGSTSDQMNHMIEIAVYAKK